MDVVIRRAGADQMHLLQEWAIREGWGAGVDDVDAFHAADPDGFLIAYADGRPAGSISVVEYDPAYSFIGYYIVDPALRGRGIGHRLFDAALDRVGGAASGLDGVREQVGTYASLGYAVAHETARFVGSSPIIAAALAGDAFDVCEARADELHELVEYDARHVPAPRPRFVRAWARPGCASRRTFVARRGGRVAGVATVRRMTTGGSRIGPLFAEDDVVARALLAAASAVGMGWGEQIAIDIPAPHASAVALAEALGMSSAFACTRMYRGEVRALPLDRVWGSATFELG